VPVDCNGFKRSHRVPDGSLRYYCNFKCKLTNVNSQLKFDIFHAQYKRPFTKQDCKKSGCTYSVWNNIVPPLYSIIHAEWGDSYKYVTTVIHLKVCKVPSSHNVNRIVTYTAREFNDDNYCQGLYTKIDKCKLNM